MGSLPLQMRSPPIVYITQIVSRVESSGETFSKGAKVLVNSIRDYKTVRGNKDLAMVTKALLQLSKDR